MESLMFGSACRRNLAGMIVICGLTISANAAPVPETVTLDDANLQSAETQSSIRMAAGESTDPARRNAIGQKNDRGEKARRERLRRERAKRARIKKNRIVKTIAGMGELNNLVKTRDQIRNRLKRLRQRQLNGDTLSSEETSEVNRLESELSNMTGEAGALRGRKDNANAKISKLRRLSRPLNDAEARELRSAEAEIAEIDKRAADTAARSGDLRARMSRLMRLRRTGNLSSSEQQEFNEAKTELETIEGTLSYKAFEVVEGIDSIIGTNAIDPNHPLMQDMIPIEPDGVFVSDQGDDGTCGYHACIMLAESRNRLTSMKELERLLPVARNSGGEATGTTAEDVRKMLDGLNLAPKVTKDFSKLKQGTRAIALASFVKKKKVSMVVGIGSGQAFKELNFQEGNNTVPESVRQASRYANVRANYPHWVVVDGVVKVNVSENSTPKWEEHFVIRDPQGLTYTHPVSTFDRGFDGEVVYPTN